MGTAVIAAPPQPAARSFLKRLRDGDKAAHLITLIFAASVFLVTVFLVYELWIHSSTSRAKFGLGFLFTSSWDPVAEKFGALPFIYGTVLTSFLALLISVPLAVGAAIFLSELAPPKLSNACTFLIELLAAVPSVIYGLLAIFTLVPFLSKYGEPFLKNTLGFLPLFKGAPLGYGYLAAGLVLAIMTFPFIISISREALLAEMLRCLHDEVVRLESTWPPDAAIVPRLEAASTWLRGKAVRVTDHDNPAQNYTGTTAGLNARGFLLVKTAEGLRTVVSGGVREA